MTARPVRVVNVCEAGEEAPPHRTSGHLLRMPEARTTDLMGDPRLGTESRSGRFMLWQIYADRIRQWQRLLGVSGGNL